MNRAAAVVPSFRPDGSELDLANVQPSDIVWTEVANGLSKIARFNGRYAEPAYPVTQHSVMGADALYQETGDPVLSGYFVLHDVHEHLFGDVTSPTERLIDHYVALARPSAAGLVRAAIGAAKAHIDLAVWRAAGLQPIMAIPSYAAKVAEMDRRMLRAEAIALFGPKAGDALPFSEPPRLTGAIRPWGPVKAEIAFLDRLQRYLGIVARVS